VDGLVDRGPPLLLTVSKTSELCSWCGWAATGVGTLEAAVTNT